MTSRKVITKSFIAALFMYFLFNSFMIYLFGSDSNKKVPWDSVYDWSPLFGILGAFFIMLALILLGAVIAKIFWNRFITDVFQVREINYGESVTIVLIIAIIVT